ITPKDIKEMTFVHFAKPDSPPGQSKKDKPEPEPEDIYKLIGTKLYEEATYYVNTSGAPVDSDIEIIESFETWDNEVAADLFAYGGETSLSGRKYNGQNTVSWARIAPKSTIAIATFWYYSNPEDFDEIIEFDIVFNSFLNWGIELTDAFDVQNIATHEVGHVVGLGDLYDSDNSEQTMYGYGSIGETKKISLEEGDIKGAQAIYNN
ncbi:matrixin family metalloprotease, partial [Chloroflexota bacterium]